MNHLDANVPINGKANIVTAELWTVYKFRKVKFAVTERASKLTTSMDITASANKVGKTPTRRKPASTLTNARRETIALKTRKFSASIHWDLSSVDRVRKVTLATGFPVLTSTSAKLTTVDAAFRPKLNASTQG